MKKRPTPEGKPSALDQRQHFTPIEPREGTQSARVPWPIVTDWHRMGEGFSVQFRFIEGRTDCVWSPGLPPARKLRRIVESGKYFAVRHQFLLQVYSQIGGAVLVLEGPQ